MVAKMILAGIAVLASVLVATMPVEALARGGFGGFRARAGFHRSSIPVFHRPVASHPIQTRPIATPKPAFKPTHHVGVAGFRGLAFHHGHRFRRNNFDSGFVFTGPTLGSDYPSTLNNDAPSYDPGSACRSQDYVVPSPDGERTVRVLRC